MKSGSPWPYLPAVPERFDDVRPRGVPCRDDGRNDSDAHRDTEERQGYWRHDGQGFQFCEKRRGLTNHTGEKHGESAAEDSADEGEKRCLPEDDAEDLALCEAEGLENSDFTDALADRHGHGVSRN